MKTIAAIAAVLFATSALAWCSTGYLVRSYYRTIGGQYVQVCVYNVVGDEVGISIPSTRMCPMTYEVCN